jgi:hypothetical protein
MCHWGATGIIAHSVRFVIGGGPDFDIRKILSGAYGETLIDVSGLPLVHQAGRASLVWPKREEVLAAAVGLRKAWSRARAVTRARNTDQMRHCARPAAMDLRSSSQGHQQVTARLDKARSCQTIVGRQRVAAVLAGLKTLHHVPGSKSRSNLSPTSALRLRWHL